MKAKTVAQVIAAEAGGKSRSQRLSDMKNIYSSMVNRANATGVGLNDVALHTGQYNAYNRTMPPGTRELVSLAEQAMREVDEQGPTHQGMYYATSAATGNLPKGLVEIPGVGGVHRVFYDPKNRSVITRLGPKEVNATAQTAGLPNVMDVPGQARPADTVLSAMFETPSPAPAAAAINSTFGPAVDPRMAAVQPAGLPASELDMAALGKAVAGTSPATGTVEMVRSPSAKRFNGVNHAIERAIADRLAKELSQYSKMPGAQQKVTAAARPEPPSAPKGLPAATPRGPARENPPSMPAPRGPARENPPAVPTMASARLAAPASTKGASTFSPRSGLSAQQEMDRASTMSKSAPATRGGPPRESFAAHGAGLNPTATQREANQRTGMPAPAAPSPQRSALDRASIKGPQTTGLSVQSQQERDYAKFEAARAQAMGRIQAPPAAPAPAKPTAVGIAPGIGEWTAAMAEQEQAAAVPEEVIETPVPGVRPAPRPTGLPSMPSMPSRPAARAYDVYSGAAPEAYDSTGRNKVSRDPATGQTRVTNEYGKTTGMNAQGYQTAVGAPSMPSMPGTETTTPGGGSKLSAKGSFGKTLSGIGGKVKSAIQSGIPGLKAPSGLTIAGAAAGFGLAGAPGAIAGAKIGSMLNDKMNTVTYTTPTGGSIKAAAPRTGGKYSEFPEAPSPNRAASKGYSYDKGQGGGRSLSPAASAAIDRGQGGLY